MSEMEKKQVPGDFYEETREAKHTISHLSGLTWTPTSDFCGL